MNIGKTFLAAIFSVPRILETKTASYLGYTLVRNSEHNSRHKENTHRLVPTPFPRQIVAECSSDTLQSWAWGQGDIPVILECSNSLCMMGGRIFCSPRDKSMILWKTIQIGLYYKFTLKKWLKKLFILYQLATPNIFVSSSQTAPGKGKK